MSFGGVLLAMSAVQAVSQIGQGYAQKAESNYNATLLQGKANLIDVQAGIQYGQDTRKAGQVASQGINSIAGMGIMPTGSAMAAMLDAQTQIGIDRAIGQFNFQQQKNQTLAEADAYKRQGKAAVSSGWSNAFSTMLTAGSNYAQYNGWGTKSPVTTAGTVRDNTFDTVYSPNQLARSIKLTGNRG